VWHAETPQVARRELLDRAFSSAATEGFTGTDEASLLERIGVRVVVVRGEPFNVKVTEREDLAVVEALLEKDR
jgi:2-C-methyl-D-erythritol 4-phosphate cytidylyltransferase